MVLSAWKGGDIAMVHVNFTFSIIVTYRSLINRQKCHKLVKIKVAKALAIKSKRIKILDEDTYRLTKACGLF